VGKSSVAAIVVAAAVCVVGIALADGSGDPTAVKDEDGKYFDKAGDPTYKVGTDGTVGVRALLHDEGNGDKAITAASYVLSSA